MKKTYMTPAVNSMFVASMSMIAASGDLQYDGENLTGTLGTSAATGDGLSKRGYSVWEDDWSAGE